MTEEFYKKLVEANEKAVKVYLREDEISKRKRENNKKYAEYYMNLVLAHVAAFNYETNTFDKENIDKDILSIFGNLKIYHSCIVESKKIGEITLGYERKNYKLLVPAFMEEENFDLKVINKMLSENGISIKSDLWDGREIGWDAYIVQFDASILIDTRKSLIANNKAPQKQLGRK